MKDMYDEDNEDETPEIDRFIFKLNSIVALFSRKCDDLLRVRISILF